MKRPAGGNTPILIISLTDRAAEALKSLDSGLCRVVWAAAFVCETNTFYWPEEEGGPEHCLVAIFESVSDARSLLGLIHGRKDEEFKAAYKEVRDVLQGEAARNDEYGRVRFDLADDEFGPIGFPKDYLPQDEED